MAKISVVINTFNEAEILPRAIKSVENFADEIVVCDMGSTDKTREVAKRLGAKVVKHRRVSYVEPARNFAIGQARGPWLLVLDPDEEVSENLAKKIKSIVKKPEADYFKIPRKNYVFGKWMKHSRWWPDYNIRLFKKGAVSWSEIIHAVPITQGNGIEIEAKESLAIIHHHYDSIEKYLEHLNRYTSVQSDLLVKDGYIFSWKDLIKKPTNEFFSRYFFGKGYKDGIHGLALSTLQAFSELVLYLKVWQQQKFKDGTPTLADVVMEMKKSEKDLHYWQADVKFKESGNWTEIIKRKFKI